MRSLLFVLLFGCVLLPGCASMTKEECLNANWQTIGYEDGMAGLPEMTLQAHRKACAKVNISPDLPLYQKGHQSGVRQYCSNKLLAYQLGVKGGAYYQVCPPDLESGFLFSYRLGQELFAIDSQIADLESRINQAESDIEQLERQIDDQEAALHNLIDASKSQKSPYKTEIYRLEREIGYRRGEITQMNRDIGFLESEYGQRQAEHKRMGY